MIVSGIRLETGRLALTIMKRVGTETVRSPGS
jgi:hypothetical protein